MGIDATGGTGTVLAEGNLMSENELCTSSRAEVEKFLIAQILLDATTGSTHS